MQKKENEDVYSQICKEYESLSRDVEWKLTAWLLAACYIYRRKVFIISTLDYKLVLSLKAKLEEYNAIQVSFPDDYPGGQSKDAAKGELNCRNGVFGNIKDYCIANANPAIEWNDFIDEISQLNVHEINKTDVRDAIKLLRGFLQLEQDRFDEIFLENGTFKNYWREALLSMNFARDGKSFLRAGWLLGYGIHLKGYRNKLGNQRVDEIWGTGDVMNGYPDGVLTSELCGAKLRNGEFHKENLKRFCMLCERLFDYASDEDDINERNEHENNLKSVNFRKDRLVFTIRIRYENLRTRFEEYIMKGRYKEGGQNLTSEAVFDFWTQSLFLTNTENFSLLDAYLTLKKQRMDV